MDKNKTGALIAAARKEKNLTQKELAKVLHVSDRAVSKWERGAGFPDVSLLEPLADALDLRVLDLLRGERTERGEDSDPQVREVLRIVAEEARKHLHWVLRTVKLCLGLCLAVLLAWRTYEFLATNGDSFSPFEDSRYIGNGYENNCKSMDGRGVYQIEVSAPGRYAVMTEPEDISALLDVLAKIQVKGAYRDWGPDSLETSLRIITSGWTPDDRFIDTEDETFELTFPAFSAAREEETTEFYFEAEIDGQDAWTVLEEMLDELAGIRE